MSKFRKWLILKLGGYVSPRTIEIKYINEYNNPPIQLATYTYINSYEEEYLGEETKNYVKERLAEQLVKRIMEEDLINITEDKCPPNMLQHLYRAKITLLKEPENGNF